MTMWSQIAHQVGRKASRNIGGNIYLQGSSKSNVSYYVGRLEEDGCFDEAGIEKGDVIVAVNGAKVKSANALQEQISKYRPGDYTSTHDIGR